MNITNTKELREAIRTPYAWPGGYKTIIILSDGEAICHECAKKEYRRLSNSLRNQSPHCNDGWYPSFWDAYWEGPPIPCTNCNKPIESAYDDPDQDTTENL